ncbi:MAG TPA: M56 family metallopeptidase [Segetibacter sp.]|nr:M56 family metallopeptidase [Segetibacter sp.]
MHPLLQSPFLQALGYAIINSLWQFAFLWLLYFLINISFKLSSQQKYASGLVLELTGFIWFIVTLIVYYNKSKLFVDYNVIDAISRSAVNGTANTLKQQFLFLIFRFEQFFPYLSIAYLALLVALFARWLYAYRFTQRVRFSGLEEIDEQWKLFVEKLSNQLGIKRPVFIFLSELVHTPLTIGFLKPIILIPIATINYLNVQQMEAVIIHELAHIRRYDYLFNLLLALIETCLFFNPFLQLIHQQVKRERENCCDDWVLKYEYSAASYARALLQIASNQAQNPLLSLNATDNKKLLISRIKRIIERNEHTFFNHKYQLLALLVLTTVFSSLSLLSPAKKTNNAVVKAEQKVTFEPIAAKVSNPLFNPVFFLANSSKIIAEPVKKTDEAKVSKSKAEVFKANKIVERSSALTAANPSLQLGLNNDESMQELASVTSDAQLFPETKATNLNVLFEKAAKNLEKSNFSIKLENILSKEASQQIELAANRLINVQKERVKETGSTLNMEKVRTQLTKALEQIKFSKKQVELDKLHTLVQIGMRKIQKEKTTTLLPDVNVFKLSELELIEKQIEREMDSINQPRFFTTRTNTNANYTFELPAVIYMTPEKPHNFSFQYSTEPVRVRSIAAPRETKISLRKKDDVIIMDNDNDEVQSIEIAPPPPVAPKQFKRVYVIKI